MNFLNIILAVFIILALVSYFYLKTKQLRSTLPIRKKWYRYRAGQSLSLFLIIFAINQIVLFQSPLTYIVSAVLAIFGLITIIGYTKRARHYGQFVKEEFALNN